MKGLNKWSNLKNLKNKEWQFQGATDMLLWEYIII